MTPENIPFHRRLHVRLILLLSLVLIIAGGAGMAVSLWIAEREFDDLLQRQFSAAATITENVFQLVAQMAVINATHLAGDDHLSATMCRDESVAQWVEPLERFRGEIKADALVVLDRDGKVLIHTGDPAQQGQSWRARRIVRLALDERRMESSIAQDMENLVMYAAVPVVAGDEEGGRLCALALVGYAINDALLQAITENSPVAITVVRRRAIMASTFGPLRGQQSSLPISFVEYEGWLNNPETIHRFRFQGQTYFASARRLPMMEPRMEGSLVLTETEDELQRIRARLIHHLAWTLVIGILLAMFLAARFAARLLTPLKRLQGHSHALVEGRTINPIQIPRRDEVGMLADDINRLVGALRASNATLERKVAERTEALEQANRKLEDQATHDALTGLANRKLFEDRLRGGIKRAMRAQGMLGLLFIDLDRFKLLNDTLGHRAGDELLREIARRLQGAVRETDTVARLGGDEFTVLLEGIQAAEDAEEVARKLLPLLAEPVSLLEGTERFVVAGSIGIACCPLDADAPERLLQCADTAMYAAKQEGRGRYVRYRAVAP